MEKKSSASSRPAKQIRVSAESIWNRPLSERQKAVLEIIASRQTGAAPVLDYSDIPALTDKQLTEFRRR